MVTGDDEEVRRRLRMEITEGDGMVIFREKLGTEIAAHDSTKDAVVDEGCVRHRSSLRAAVRATIRRRRHVANRIATTSMPELPEVETVRRSLLDRVVGRAITGLRAQTFAGIMGDTAVSDVEPRLRDRRIVGIRRRGKYLFFDLDDDSSVMIHLRMTGQLRLTERETPPLRFEHLAIELDDGGDLRFADQRKFGRVLHLLPADVRAIEQRLGPEPLAPTFTADVLAVRLARRLGKIKNVLLDQRLVAGLGNIYVDEALFRARLHPEQLANTLTNDDVRRLHRAIRAVIRESIAQRGTTFSSFQDGDGYAGNNQRLLRVYGRGAAGEPCVRCGRPLKRIVVGARGTHFCPHCQPSPTDAAT